MEIKIVTSKDNATLKFAKSLQNKKVRIKENLLLIEGKKMVSDLIKLNVEIKTIFVSEQTKDFILALNPPPSVEIIELQKNLIKELTHQTTSQEIVAVVQAPNAQSMLPTTNFLVLDGLQNAGNVGTIMRTALATNFKTIYLIDCVDVFSEKVVDASMTAIFHLNLVKIGREEFIDLALKHDLKLVSGELDGVNACKFTPKYDIMGLVCGNEGNGVSPKISKICQEKLTLPMNSEIESLNVSVSAGVLMYLINMKKYKNGD